MQTASDVCDFVCESQAEEHSSHRLTGSESAALTRWTHEVKAKEEGRHLPPLRNSTKTMHLFSSPFSSFSLHSVCVKRVCSSLFKDRAD